MDDKIYKILELIDRLELPDDLDERLREVLYGELNEEVIHEQ